jgi:heme/copper-type cytochrome/quinol oxidase subunit 4
MSELEFTMVFLIIMQFIQAITILSIFFHIDRFFWQDQPWKFIAKAKGEQP